MASVNSPADTNQVNHGWRVVFAGLGINLALGVLYSWSVVSKGIPEAWEWTQRDKSLPYSVACLVFSVMMVPAGRMLDRLGPRLVASIGGLLVGAGFILSSFTISPMGFALGFGLLAGSGFGFGYAAATPPAVRWFPASKTGMIAGIVVSGFGLASVYTAPLTEYLIGAVGIPSTFMILGAGFLMVVVGLAQLLIPPPAGYVPPGSTPKAAAKGGDRKEDYRPLEVLGTWQFYLLWFLFACGAGAGLMIISKMADIAKIQASITQGSIVVAFLAVGNGCGRIGSGIVSDRIGRRATLFLCFVLQAAAIMILSRATVGSPLAQLAILAFIAAIIGANYGANLALFPSITKDYFGLANFGSNYGLVFTAWGLGGFALSLLAGEMYTKYKTFNFAYYCSAALLVLAALGTLMLRPPHRTVETN